jgi:outer membrane protein TolC
MAKRPNGAEWRSWTGSLALACTLALFLGGCSSAHYQKSADKQVYSLVAQVEQQLFGHTNAFTINTPWSSRAPSSITPQELITDRYQTNTRTITIDDALWLSVTNSRRYQTAKEQLYLTALTLTGEKHAFTPNFFATITGNYDRSANGDQIGSVNSRLGVSQLLATGGKVGVNLANDLLRYYTGDPRRLAVSVMSLNFTQPLLRGFGPNSSAVESLTQSERNTVYAVRTYSYFQNQWALEIVNDYFNLLAQKDIIRNRYTNYLGRVQVTQRLEARVGGGRESINAVDQARQSELTAKNNYINSIATYLNSLDDYKIKLGLPPGDRVRLVDEPLEELQAAGLLPVSLDKTAAYRLATQHQFLVLNAIDQFEDSQRKVRVAADKLKPGLNLFADASLESERPRDYANFDPDNWRGGVGVELNLPLDRLAERNNYRASLVSFQSQLRALTLTLDNLQANVDRAVRTLAQRRQNYEIQRNALTLANRRVLSTELLLQAGRADIRDVIDAQDAQINAQNQVVAAQVSYQEARLQLMLDLGVLNTTPQKFWFQDHLPADMTPPTSRPALDLPREQLIPPDVFFNQ